MKRGAQWSIAIVTSRSAIRIFLHTIAAQIQRKALMLNE
jgi:hypothetical protein